MDNQKQITIGALSIVALVFAGFFLSQKDAPPNNPDSTVFEQMDSFEPAQTEPEFNPISIPAYSAKAYSGTDLKLGTVQDNNSAYTRYHITYKSGALTISGIMNVPKGEVPAGGFPVLFLNHGYIDPAIYTNGRGLKREQDYFARRGYVVIHSDYRNHAESSKDPEADVNFRLGYVEDVINGIYAMKNSDLGFFNRDKIGMLGHSMGGGVALNTMVIQPDLVDAFVLFAPVSADIQDNFNRWMVTRPETVVKIIAKFGTPEANPDFWRNASPVNFLDKIKSAVLLHHGTADADVPIEWSDRLAEDFDEAGKSLIYHKYDGQPHEFTTSWSQVMERSLEFFGQNLK